MRIQLFIALLGSLILFSACSKEITGEMVIGHYVANHNKGVDTLEINADGTYKYQYIASDGKEIKNSNKWEFQHSDGKPIITFSNFVFGLPGYGTENSGFWIVEVKRSFAGKLKLIIDPDLNIFFEKQIK